MRVPVPFGKNSVLLKTIFDYGGKKKKGAKRP
jgi:hypothetical protein